MFSSVQPVVSSLIPSCFFSADSDKEIAVVLLFVSKLVSNQPTNRQAVKCFIVVVVADAAAVVVVVDNDDH